MSRGRTCRLAIALLVVVALLVLTIDAPFAGLRIFWRYVVLSYDNPATQTLDEMACESSPPSQAGLDAGQSTRVAATSHGQLTVPDTPKRPGSPALSSGITRSPPAA
jgi:hypothetical protein